MTKQEKAKQYLETLDRQKLFTDVKYNEEFTQLFYELFGEIPCGSCPGRMEGYITQLTILSNNKSIMTNSNFKIKGGVLHSQANQTTYNNESITDDAALGMIAENENFKGAFVLPENFEELMSDFLKRKSAPLEPKAEEPAEKITEDPTPPAPEAPTVNEVPEPAHVEKTEPKAEDTSKGKNKNKRN